MRVKYQRAGEFLFRYGDVGKLFYIVLEGQASVQVPSSNEMNVHHRMPGDSPFRSIPTHQIKYDSQLVTFHHKGSHDKKAIDLDKELEYEDSSNSMISSESDTDMAELN